MVVADPNFQAHVRLAQPLRRTRRTSRCNGQLGEGWARAQPQACAVPCDLSQANASASSVKARLGG